MSSVMLHSSSMVSCPLVVLVFNVFLPRHLCTSSLSSTGMGRANIHLKVSCIYTHTCLHKRKDCHKHKHMYIKTQTDLHKSTLTQTQKCILKDKHTHTRGHTHTHMYTTDVNPPSMQMCYHWLKDIYCSSLHSLISTETLREVVCVYIQTKTTRRGEKDCQIAFSSICWS